MSDDNKLITERKKKLEELSSVTKLYPNTFRRNTNANELRQKYDGKSKEELESEDNIFSVSGRLLTVRKMGNSTFANLHDDSGKIQLFLSKNGTGKDMYSLLNQTDLGDIIGAKGKIFKTKTGELSINVLEYIILSKPFITHHNSLDMNLYLRIAPELYLKRLIIGGFEKVFEINRSFRNEGLSVKHNPEFTMIEFYAAYEDYTYLMNLIEKLIKSLIKSTGLDEKFEYQEYEINRQTPFEKLNFHQSIIKYCDEINDENINDYSFLEGFCKSNDIEITIKNSIHKTQLDIFDKIVECKLINPTFATEYPTAVSPLSRRSDDNPDVVERFELFIAGREIANGFSELNDPQDQAKRFSDQLEDEDEKMNYDSDFITAMEYGMPPTAGAGIGIDRLVMLLTNSASIRDVLFFPLMKPKS